MEKVKVGDDDDEPQVRIRSRLHQHIYNWTQHWSFNGSIMFCILVNAITLAVETDESLPPDALAALKALDNVFLAVYTLEFLVKMYVSPTAYFTNGFNIFDFIVLVLSWVDLIMSLTSSGANSSQLAGFRVLRILRTLRALRTISFVPAMQVIVTALMTTIRYYMLNLMVVLFLLMFIFGVMAYYLYGSTSTKFGTLGQSMLALTTMVTSDSWTEVEMEVDGVSGARWFCLAFIVIGSYVYINVFVSIVIVNMNNATQAYIDADRAQRRQIVAEKTITMNHKQKEEAASFRLFLEQDQRAKFAHYEELLQSVNTLLKTVDKPDEEILCGDTSLNLLFVQRYLSALDQIDNETYMQRNLYRELGNIFALVIEKRLENNGEGEDLMREREVSREMTLTSQSQAVI